MDRASSSKTPFEGNTKIPLNLDLNLTPEKERDIHPGQSSMDNTEIMLNINVNMTPEIDLDILHGQILRGEIRMLKPEWLERFLKCSFYEACAEHPWDELNKYCTDCDAPLCNCCVSISHRDHKLLRMSKYICRGVGGYNYHGVVRAVDIKKHIDCSQIQLYTNNDLQVLALVPLPLKRLRTRFKEPKCRICTRKLIDRNLYSYCSISCKVQASEGRKEEIDLNKTIVDELVQYRKIDLNKLSFDQLPEMEKQEPGLEVVRAGEQLMDMANQVGNHPRKRACRRKGVPQRAPFF